MTDKLTLKGIEVVTVGRAAEMIGCTPSTVRTQITKGLLVAMKPDGAGRINYVTVASVQQYIKERAGKVGKYTRKPKSH